MKSAFNIEDGKWNINWPARIAQYDLVYKNPPLDPTQGLPIGNGEVGVLMWCEADKIIFALNKSDLWDDSPNDRFRNWNSAEEESSTCLRHAGRIVIDFKLPVFDPFYLTTFNARLSIADGHIYLASESVFGTVGLEGFVDWHSGAFMTNVIIDLNQPVSAVARLERYGSRTFSHWYASVKRNPEIGLHGTKSHVDNSAMYVVHPLSSGNFTIGCSIESDYSAELTTVHSYAAEAVFENIDKSFFTLTTVITSPMKTGSRKYASELLKSINDADRDQLHKSHDSAWKDFWMCSFVDCGNDYYNNLWHLYIYYLACCQRGKYPGRFINGLWSWNRDVQNWNFYFHWNQQQLYWPLNAAGHSELVDSYLNYRFNSLKYAQKDAKELFGVDGAFVSDVCDRLGRNSESEAENHTPVAQIAMEFWRQYQYTGDVAFLKEKAWPYIRAAAIFFESRFELGSDGFYHAKEGTGYEGWIKLKDSITELVSGKVLFDTAVTAAGVLGLDETRVAKWKDIASRITELPVSDDIIPDNKIAMGPYKGETAEGKQCLAAGWGVEKKKIVFSFYPKTPTTLSDSLYDILLKSEIPGQETYPETRDIQCYDGIFPCAEYSAVFPCGMIGIKDKDTALYKAAVNTAKSYAPSVMGWDAVPIVLARLGLASETWDAIGRMPRNWQFYCNGFTHYGPQDGQKAESSLPFKQFMVFDADKLTQGIEEKFKFASWPFRHAGLEAMGVFSAAINEALLQSWDGVIRIAPALEDNQDASFTLHAVGGFVVSSEIKRGKVLWVDIRSTRDGNLKLESPWQACSVYRDLKLENDSERGIIQITAKAGDRLLFVPEGFDIASWKTTKRKVDPNFEPKTDPSGLAILGLEQAF